MRRKLTTVFALTVKIMKSKRKVKLHENKLLFSQTLSQLRIKIDRNKAIKLHTYRN